MTPRSSGWTRHCSPATTARCWPRRRPWCARRHCENGVGSCWRWRSTSRVDRARRSGPSRSCDRLLVTELGLDPGPELVDLEAAILRQDPELLVETAPAHQDEGCPYRGLTPYDVDDADGFFGRDADVASCLERLASKGVLAVVGPSGSGKSSLVRAGVAAALVRDGKAVVVISPGTHPVDMLSALPERVPAAGSGGRPVRRGLLVVPGHRRAAHVPGQACGACPDGTGDGGPPRRPHGRCLRRILRSPSWWSGGCTCSPQWVARTSRRRSKARPGKPGWWSSPD